MNHLAGHIIIKAAYYTHILQGDPIVPHYPPHGASIDHVEGFLEVNEIDVTLVIATPMIVPVWCAVLLSGQCRTCHLWSLIVHLSTCCLLLFSVYIVVFSSGLCWVLTDLSNFSSLSSLLSSTKISWSSPCIIRADVTGSALIASGGLLSGPGAFPTMIFVMALDISSVVTHVYM